MGISEIEKMSTVVKSEDIIGATPQPRTVSDLILEYLMQVGVDHIFGIPGGAIEPLFDAIARQKRLKPRLSDSDFQHKVRRRHDRESIKTIKMITTRHEAGAAFMADGYSRETGKLGVCCATTGPGTTNLITGVASAYLDRTPMLVITPQTALPNFGKQSFQDSSGDAIDVVSMFEPCTRYNTFVSHIEQLERKLFEAIYTAFRHPRGPVHLSIPMDVMAQQVETRGPLFHVASMLRQFNSYDQQGFVALCKLLKTTKKVVLFLGEGCLEYAERIVQFAELIGAQIVTTPSGKGCISAYHPLYRGVFGFAGHECATRALLDDSVDVVMAIGSTFGEFETSGWCDDTILNEEKLVHIDAANENFSQSPMARLHVYGNLGTLFCELLNHFHDEDYQKDYQHLIDCGTRAKKLKMPADVDKELCLRKVVLSDVLAMPEVNEIENLLKPVKPQYLMFELARQFPSRTRFVIDVGNSWSWATHFLNQHEPGKYRVGMGFGAMGWAIGAAIGTALAEHEAPVVCVTGDGSYLMSGQELTVAVEQQLQVVFVILNDQSLGMIKYGQRLGGGEQIGYELPDINFAMMAEAIGANGVTISTTKELLDLDFENVINHKGPVLLDVRIDPEEVPPMGMRIKSLGREK